MVLFLAFWIWSNHPIHIAVSDVSYSEKSQSLQVAHKIYLDDVEREIEEEFGSKIRFVSNSKDNTHINQVKSYVEKHVGYIVNGKKIVPEFIGYETDNEAIWIYQEVTKLKKLKRFSMRCDFLQSMYDDQKNLANINYLGQKKSFLFRKGTSEETAEFD